MLLGIVPAQAVFIVLGEIRQPVKPLERTTGDGIWLIAGLFCVHCMDEKDQEVYLGKPSRKWWSLRWPGKWEMWDEKFKMMENYCCWMTFSKGDGPGEPWATSTMVSLTNISTSTWPCLSQGILSSQEDQFFPNLYYSYSRCGQNWWNYLDLNSSLSFVSSSICDFSQVTPLSEVR